LNPNYSTAHHWLGECLSMTGRFAEAAASLQRAERLEPLSLAIKEDIGGNLYRSRQYDKALQALHDVLALDQNFTRAHVPLGRIYEAQGRYAEALAEYSQTPFFKPLIAADPALKQALEQTDWRGFWQRVMVLRQTGPNPEASDPPTMLYVRLGDYEQALALMEKNFAEKHVVTPLLKTDPFFDPLRANPRFSALLQRAGLTP